MDLARKSGIGAQFGGKYFALDARVIRLPRHGASCPVGIGVSCSADRNIKARIDRDGIWLEELERDPARFIPAQYRSGLGAQARRRDRPQPADEGDPRRALEVPDLHPAEADRDDRGRARHRPRQDQGAARPGRGHARLLEGPSRLLRRSGQDPGGAALRLVRPDDRRPDGQLRGPVPVARRLDGDDRQGQPLAGR